ncbi:RNA polymerase sigma factor [candidate division KSB1 bacterium]|nr:RNA polymerase sigma factor [candidate division KSB1 bacterium]
MKRLQKFQKFSDEQLMKRIRQGSSEAFDTLYARYSRKLLHFLYRSLGGDESKAQDFLHDIFLKIIEKPERFSGRSSFKSWIFTVACNLCKNEYRRQTVRKAVESKADMDEIALIDENPIDEIVDQKMFKTAMLQELGTFSPNQRCTFLLRFQQGMSIAEIAEIFDCSEGTVKSRLFYTTRKLAQNLHQFNPNRSEVGWNEKKRM